MGMSYDNGVVSFRYRPRLKITETFLSLQGEGAHAGLPCTFVRLTGCALRCSYCDTSYAFYGGEWREFDALYEDVAAKGARLVQITGGEPLHQKAAWPFIDGLVARGFKPLIETSGAVAIDGLHPEAHVVLDLKTPGSGESARMMWSNLDLLKPTDEIKFVVCDERDLDWSLDKIRELDLDRRFQVLVSPIASLENKGAMADRMLAAGTGARFQVQLHKILWGDTAGK